MQITVIKYNLSCKCKDFKIIKELKKLGWKIKITEFGELI